MGTGRTTDLRAGRALGLAVRRGLERVAAPFDRRAALAGLDGRAAFLAVVGLAFAFDRAFALGLALTRCWARCWALGRAFAAAVRLAGLAAAFVWAAALFRAAALGFLRAAGLVLAADFDAALGRDAVAGRAADFRRVAGLAVAFFRAAIPFLKSASAACPLGRRSIWRRPSGGKLKGEKPHNSLKIKEFRGKYLTTAGH